MILTPYGYQPGSYPSEVVGSIGPNGTYLCPKDPQYNQTGEDGFYHDTHLGGDGAPQVISMGPHPSDFAVAQSYRYTPNSRGWVATKDGYIQGPYYPTAPLAPALGLPMAPVNLSDALIPETPDEIRAAAERDAKRKELTFKLSLITTAAVGISALIAIVRTSAGLRDDIRSRRTR